MTAKRLDYLDMVKGIAIILVVLGHIDLGTNPICIWLYSFHLPLFFIVSGILINYKQEMKLDFKIILRKKSFVLLFPYFSFSILYLIYDILKLLIFNKGTLLSILQNIYLTLSLFGISTLWFLPCLFLGEMLFIFTSKKFSDKSWLIIFSFTISSIVVSIVLNQYQIISGTSMFKILKYFFITIFRSFIAMSFIGFGYYIFSLQKNTTDNQETRSKKELIFGITLFIINIFLSQQNSLVDLHYLIINNAFLYYITSIIGSLSILSLCKNLKLLKVLSFYGINSLVIMVTHLYFPVINIARKIAGLLIPNILFNSKYFIDFISLGIVMILEYFIVIIINNYFAFMLGKRGRQRFIRIDNIFYK